MRALILLAALALAGCADFGARAVSTGTFLADEAESYVREVHAQRQWVRQECRSILEEQVREARSKGDTEAALALLRGNYPALVTLDIYEQARANPAAVLSEPFNCNGQDGVDLIGPAE